MPHTQNSPKISLTGFWDDFYVCNIIRCHLDVEETDFEVCNPCLAVKHFLTNYK